MKELAPGFGRTLLERHGKGAQRLLEMWQGLKPGLFLRAFSARLKSCPVTKLASVEFLRQTETLARHPNSNAIALGLAGSDLDRFARATVVPDLGRRESRLKQAAFAMKSRKTAVPQGTAS